MGGKKKFTNSKKEEAHLAKAEKKQNDKNQQAKNEEDEFWEDEGDKKMQKKKQRELEQQKKQAEKQRLDDEKKKLIELEEKKLKGKKNRSSDIEPVTQYQAKLAHEAYIENILEKNKVDMSKIGTMNPDPMALNNNHDSEMQGPTDIDGGLEMFEKLNGEEKEERHPEKRRKAAWKIFLERRTLEMKEKNPRIKRSQIMDKAYREFQKSPENPMNQQ